MTEPSETTKLLPRVAELRRNACEARLLAAQASTAAERLNLVAYADDLDRDADALEVRLAIHRAAMAAAVEGNGAGK
jgi:hypothetical protein